MSDGSLENAILSSDYIRREIKKIGLKYIHDMSQASDNAISAFYSDYKPKFYQRVFGLKPIYQIETSYSDTDVTMTIDFIYSPDFITGHNNPDIIFRGPFEQGYHGGPIRSAGTDEGSFAVIKTHKNYSPAHEKMSPSPYEMIEAFYDSYEI